MGASLLFQVVVAGASLQESRAVACHACHACVFDDPYYGSHQFGSREGNVIDIRTQLVEKQQWLGMEVTWDMQKPGFCRAYQQRLKAIASVTHKRSARTSVFESKDGCFVTKLKTKPANSGPDLFVHEQDFYWSTRLSELPHFTTLVASHHVNDTEEICQSLIWKNAGDVWTNNVMNEQHRKLPNESWTWYKAQLDVIIATFIELDICPRDLGISQITFDSTTRNLTVIDYAQYFSVKNSCAAVIERAERFDELLDDTHKNWKWEQWKVSSNKRRLRATNHADLERLEQLYEFRDRGKKLQPECPPGHALVEEEQRCGPEPWSKYKVCTNEKQRELCSKSNNWVQINCVVYTGHDSRKDAVDSAFSNSSCVAGKVPVRVESWCKNAAQALDLPYLQQDSWDKGVSPHCKKHLGSENRGVYFNSDGLMAHDALVCESI
jgi:hypothetical protein